MGGIIGIIIAVLAVFLLFKAVTFILKLVAILLLAGVAVAAFVVIRKKLGRSR